MKTYTDIWSHQPDRALFIGDHNDSYEETETMVQFRKAVRYACNIKPTYFSGYDAHDIKQIVNDMATQRNRVIVGSELGASIALQVAAETMPDLLILVNPVVGMGDLKTCSRYAVRGDFKKAFASLIYPDMKHERLGPVLGTQIIVVSTETNNKMHSYIAKRLDATFTTDSDFHNLLERMI